jgi:hypothetical protein
MVSNFTPRRRGSSSTALVLLLVAEGLDEYHGEGKEYD